MTDRTVWPEFRLDGPNQDQEWVKVKVAGDPKMEIDRKVRDEDRERWPDEYQRFKDGVVDPAAGGTPLKDWSEMTITRINQLNSLNIYTCEQLRDVSDGNLRHLGMGAREEREKVQAWLKEKASKPPYEDLEKRVAELEARLSEMSEKRGPGRPRKEAA